MFGPSWFLKHCSTYTVVVTLPPAKQVDCREKGFKGALNGGQGVGDDLNDKTLPWEPRLNGVAFSPKQQNTLRFPSRIAVDQQCHRQ